MLWDEPKIFFLERRYFFSIILSEFLKNRVALQRHPEVMLPDGKINIVVQQAQSREQMETMVKSMARAAVEELMAGMKLVPETSDPGQAPAPTVNLDDMLNNLDIFKGL